MTSRTRRARRAQERTLLAAYRRLTARSQRLMRAIVSETATIPHCRRAAR